MSPRHSARPGRHASLGLRLAIVLVVMLGGGVGGLLTAAHYAHPARPELSPRVSDPAMLAASGSSSEAATSRGDSVSRSSARGASERPTARPTPRPTPTRPHPTPPNTSRPGTPSPTGDPNRSVEQQVLDLTNQQRAQTGCGPLAMDQRLHAAAQDHSQDMADKDYFAHNDPDGTTPWDRAKAAGYPDPSAENIAIGFASPAAVMKAWMDSPGHRANILNCDSHDLGVGYVVDPNRGAIWTQLFGYG